MTIIEPRSHCTSLLTTGLRLSALGRRVFAPEPLASILVDLAFGEPRRDDVATLHVTSAARIAAYGGRSR